MDMRSRRNRGPVSVDVTGRKSSRGKKKSDDAYFVANSPQDQVDINAKRNIVADYKKTVLQEVISRRTEFASSENTIKDVAGADEVFSDSKTVIEDNNGTLKHEEKQPENAAAAPPSDDPSECNTPSVFSLIAQSDSGHGANEHDMPLATSMQTTANITVSATSAGSSETKVSPPLPLGAADSAISSSGPALSVRTSPPKPPTGGEGVYLSGGREMSMSPAFGSEQYDAMQREHILRSMQSASAVNMGRAPPSPAPTMVPAPTKKVHDLFSDSVSLLSNVPAAMQQQQMQQQARQYSLAMMNAASGGPKGPSSPMVGVQEGSGLYLSGAMAVGQGNKGTITPSTLKSHTVLKPGGTPTASSLPPSKPGTPVGPNRGLSTSAPGRLLPTPKSPAIQSNLKSPAAKPPVGMINPSSIPGIGIDIRGTGGLAGDSTMSVVGGQPSAQLSAMQASLKDKLSQAVATGKTPKGNVSGSAAESKDERDNASGQKSQGKIAPSQGVGRAQGQNGSGSGGSARDKDDGHLMLQKRHDMLKTKLAAIERREMLAYRAPPFKVPRLKTHWDYVLDEVQWMAIDFRQERRWKTSQSRAVGGLCAEAVGLRSFVAKRQGEDESIQGVYEPVSGEIRYTIWREGLTRMTRGAHVDEDPTGPLKTICKRQADTLKRGLFSALMNVRKTIHFSGKCFGESDSPESGDLASLTGGSGTEARGKLFSASGEMVSFATVPSTQQSKMKKEPFILTEADLLALDEAITSQYGALCEAMQDTSANGYGFVQWKSSVILTSDQERVKSAVLQRSRVGLGCVVYGKHSTGKTTACASVVTSWLSHEGTGGGSKPVMIVCSRYCVDRWKYEIRKFSPECSFLVLDEELFLDAEKTFTHATINDVKGAVIRTDVVFCCNGEFLRRKVEDGNLHSVVGSMSGVTWGGVMIDMRSLAGMTGPSKVSSCRAGPCWDGDGVVCSMSGSLAPIKASKALAADASTSLSDPLSSDRLQAERSMHALYTAWLQCVTFAFPIASVPKCCLSGLDFLGDSAASVLSVDSLRSLIATWLCFSITSAFRDTSPENTSLASERWIQWQSHLYRDKSFLLDGLIPVGRIIFPFSDHSFTKVMKPASVKSEPGVDDSAAVKAEKDAVMDETDEEMKNVSCTRDLLDDTLLVINTPELIAVDMGPTHADKYNSIMSQFCAHSLFGAVHENTSAKFEQFAKVLVVIRRICFHEDMVHISTLDEDVTTEVGMARDYRKFAVHQHLTLALDSNDKKEEFTSLEDEATTAKTPSKLDTSYNHDTPSKSVTSESSSPHQVSEKDTEVSAASTPTATLPPGTPATVATADITSPQAAGTVTGPPVTILPSIHITAQFSSCLRLFQATSGPATSGKFDALLRLIEENVSKKVAIVVNTYEEHVLTHRFLSSRKVPHLYAGLPEVPYHGDHMITNWFAAQRAVRQFNDTEANNQHNDGCTVILVCSWLFSSEGLDEAHRLCSSFSCARPVSANLVVSLSSDWMYEADFSTWFMGLDESRDCVGTRRVVRLVYRNTIEESMYESFVWNSTDCSISQFDLMEYDSKNTDDLANNSSQVYDAIASDVRLRCPLISLQGKRMEELFNVHQSSDAKSSSSKLDLHSMFLEHAPVMTPHIITRKTLMDLFVKSSSPLVVTHPHSDNDKEELTKDSEAASMQEGEGSTAETKPTEDVAVPAVCPDEITLTITLYPETRADIATMIKTGRDWITSLRNVSRKVENEFSAIVVARTCGQKAKSDKKKKSSNFTTLSKRQVSSRIVLPLTTHAKTSGVASKNKHQVSTFKSHGRNSGSESKAVVTGVAIKARQQHEVSAENHRLHRVLMAIDEYMSRAHSASDYRMRSRPSYPIVVYLARTFVGLSRSASTCLGSQDMGRPDDKNYVSGVANGIWDSLVEAVVSADDITLRQRVDNEDASYFKDDTTLRNVYYHRFARDGFGTSSSAHLFRLINEPNLRPKIVVASTGEGTKRASSVTFNGIDSISAFKTTCVELKRRGQLLDPKIFANPLQMTTGRDLLACPSWLETVSRMSDFSFTLSFGSAAMSSVIPVVTYASNGKGSNKVKKASKTAAGTSVSGDAAPPSATAPGTAPAAPRQGSGDAVPPLSTGGPTGSKEVPKHPYPAAAMRFHPCGTGWRRFGPTARSTPTEPASTNSGAGTVGSAFLSGLPLGRDGKKYRFMGEQRVGGVVSGTSTQLPSCAESDVLSMSNTLGHEKFQTKAYDMSRVVGADRGSSRSENVVWTEAEDKAIYAASQLLLQTAADENISTDGAVTLRANKRKVEKVDYAGSGWLMERMLDQCPPLAASGSKSSRQAVGHRRHLISQKQIVERERAAEGRSSNELIVHQKRNFDEMSSTEDTQLTSDGIGDHPKKLLKQHISQDRHSAVGLDISSSTSSQPLLQRPRSHSIGERLRLNVSHRLQQVIDTSTRSNLKTMVTSLSGGSSSEKFEVIPALIPTHPSHDAAISSVVSNASLNPVQILELERQGTSSTGGGNGTADSQSYLSGESMSSQPPGSSSVGSSHSSSGSSGRPMAPMTSSAASYPSSTSPFSLQQGGGVAAPPMFVDRSSPYLLASATPSHPIGSSPYLVSEEPSDNSVSALSALPPPVSSMGGGSGSQQSGGMSFPGLLSMDSSGLVLPQLLKQQQQSRDLSESHARSTAHGEDGMGLLSGAPPSSGSEGAPTFSHDSRNLSHLKQIADSDPSLKAQVIEILSQQNISDHRKGELLRSLMDRTRLPSTGLGLGAGKYGSEQKDKE